MKKLVWWLLLILAVGCSSSGEKAEPRVGEVVSQAGSTALQSTPAEPSPAPTAPAEPAQSTQPAPLAGQTAAPGPETPKVPIAMAIAKKEVEDISWESRKALHGIKEVYLLVWGFLDPEAIKAGLTEDLLHQEVKEKLEKAGIKVLDKGITSSDPGQAAVYVKMDIRKRQTQDVYLGHIDLSLFQYMYLGRNPKLVLLAECWTTRTASFIYSKENLVQFTRMQVASEADSFVEDYVKFNPGAKAAEASPSKSKPAAGKASEPSSKPSQAEKKPATEPPVTAPKPAAGGTAKSP